MKFVLLLLCVASALALSEPEYQTLFTNWMQANSKSYAHDVFQARYQIWKNNYNFITSYNAQGKSTVLAMNSFGDMTNTEFSQYYMGLKMPATLPAAGATAVPNAPASVDWRKSGAVTAIKNQGQCGSCWAFSTTGSVEGCHQINTQKLVSLSEQNLMDCSWSQGNQGCDGGLMTQAMQYIISNGGIDTEASYAYTAESSQTCLYQASTSGSTETSFTNVNTGDETDLMNKVAMGPTSVAIDASQSSFQFYSSGVYSDPNCSTSQLDHGVLAVGYDHDSTSNQDYWIVKNSWGTDWGMSGYIWMARNDNNMCGIATMATLPQTCS
jgi:cathepsin L